MTESRRRDWFALAFLAILPTVLFLDVVLGKGVFYIRDVAAYHFPLKRILREVVLRGEFPFWNAWVAAGQPLAANPAHEVFYPLTWLILLPDFIYAFQLLALVHVHIALCGTWALLRSLGVSRTAAAAGALSFGLGGFILSGLHFFPFLFSAAWMPFTFLFGRRAILERQPRDIALAVFFLAIQCLIGEPVMLLQTGFVLGTYAIAVAWPSRRVPSIGRNLLLVAAIGIGALLVAAVQIVPALDHARDSVRSSGFSFETVTEWSTPPIRFAELFFPDMFGSFAVDTSEPAWATAIYPKRFFPFFPAIYGGILAAVLAVAGLFAGVRGRGLYLAILTASGLLALGNHTVLFRMLYEAGLVRSIRYPEKFLIMGLFATAVFSAIALDALLEGNARMHRWVRRITIALAAVALVGVASTMIPGADRTFRDLWSIEAHADVASALTAARNGWLLAALRLLLAFAAFTLIPRLPRRRAAFVLLLFIAIDTGSRTHTAAPRTGRSFYEDPPPSIAQLPLDRSDYRVFLISDAANSTRSLDYNTATPYRSILHRNALQGATPATYGIRTVMERDYDLTALRRTNEFNVAMWNLSERSPEWLNYAAAMSNVWYVGLYRHFEEAAAEARGDARLLNPIRFVGGLHYPRYYFASAIVPITGRADFEEKLASGRYDRRSAFIESSGAFRPRTGRVLTVVEGVNRAALEVETAGPAFLVLSVTGHKYWSVTIDGIEVEPVTTNLAYQGVPVPPGRHVVTMRYRNPLIAAGAGVSAAAILGFLLFAVRGRSIGTMPAL